MKQLSILRAAIPFHRLTDEVEDEIVYINVIIYIAILFHSIYNRHLSNEALSGVTSLGMIQELVGRAAARGEQQRKAFESMVATARMAVRASVDVLLAGGYPPDGETRESPYQNSVRSYWALRQSRGYSVGEKYGGGNLLQRPYRQPTVNTMIVMDGNGGLTVAKYYPDQDSEWVLEHPDESEGDVFNVNTLLASPALCGTVLAEVLADVAATTTRVISGRRL